METQDKRLSNTIKTSLKLPFTSVERLKRRIKERLQLCGKTGRAEEHSDLYLHYQKVEEIKEKGNGKIKPWYKQKTALPSLAEIETQLTSDLQTKLPLKQETCDSARGCYFRSLKDKDQYEVKWLDEWNIKKRGCTTNRAVEDEEFANNRLSSTLLPQIEKKINSKSNITKDDHERLAIILKSLQQEPAKVDLEKFKEEKCGVLENKIKKKKKKRNEILKLKDQCLEKICQLKNEVSTIKKELSPKNTSIEKTLYYKKLALNDRQTRSGKSRSKSGKKRPVSNRGMKMNLPVSPVHKQQTMKNSQSQILELRKKINDQCDVKLEKLESRLKSLKEEFQKEKRDLYNYYTEKIRQGVDIRDVGIIWAIKGIKMLNYGDIDLHRMPRFLDPTAIEYLLKRADKELELDTKIAEATKLRENEEMSEARNSEIPKSPRHNLKNRKKILPSILAESTEVLATNSDYRELLKKIEQIKQEMHGMREAEFVRLQKEFNKHKYGEKYTIDIQTVFLCLFGADYMKKMGDKLTNKKVAKKIII